MGRKRKVAVLANDAREPSGYRFGVMAKTPRIGPKHPVHAYIAEWREHKGLTQERLGGLLGVDKGTISRWERSKRIPSLNVLAAICEALDIHISAIYRPPSDQTVDEILHNAPHDVRQQVVDLAEFLVSRRRAG
jgi:transcriptional regulator with XRE-family HTH domain